MYICLYLTDCTSFIFFQKRSGDGGNGFSTSLCSSLCYPYLFAQVFSCLQTQAAGATLSLLTFFGALGIAAYFYDKPSRQPFVSSLPCPGILLVLEPFGCISRLDCSKEQHLWRICLKRMILCVSGSLLMLEWQWTLLGAVSKSTQQATVQHVCKRRISFSQLWAKQESGLSMNPTLHLESSSQLSWQQCWHPGAMQAEKTFPYNNLKVELGGKAAL